MQLLCFPLCLVLVMGVWSRDLPLNATQDARAKRASELFRKTTFSGSGSSVLSDFHPDHIWGLDALSSATDPADSHAGHVLRVHYAKNSYSHTHDRDYGAGFYARPTSHHTAMMLSYDLYFACNFNFVKGGKLPGLWGGATENCSGGRHSTDCFSTRFMWRADGAGEVYAYIPEDGQESDFCSRSDVYCNFEKGNSLGRGKWTFRRCQWHNIAQYVHLNDPGHANGYIRVFLDGHKVYEIRDIVLRTKSSINIDGMYFSTFFGGADSSWATPVDTHTYFKNFVFSMDSSHPTIIG